MPDETNQRLLIEQALGGDAVAVRALVDDLAPVIAKRVAATLWRANSKRNVRQDASDMIQDVFLALFQSEGKALRAWTPGRGMSLHSFVGLLARHQVVSILRSGRTSPWREELGDGGDFDELQGDAETPEAVFSSREHMTVLFSRLRDTLSPRGMELFQRLVVDEEPLEAVAAGTGMTREALYQWRSRLLRTLRTLAAEIDGPAMSDTAGKLRMLKGGPAT